MLVKLCIKQEFTYGRVYQYFGHYFCCHSCHFYQDYISGGDSVYAAAGEITITIVIIKPNIIINITVLNINIIIIIIIIIGEIEGGQDGQDHRHPGLPNSVHAEQSNHPVS